MLHKIWLATALLLGSPITLWAAPDNSQARSLSIYEVRPWVDGPVLGVAALGAAVPVLFQKRLVHEQCPCDSRDVNSFDRPVIGNDNKAAGWGSHFTVALAISVPLYLDYKDLGFNKTLAEDFTVYAEVLAINSSLNNLARFTVQRPRPEVYSQNPPPTDAGSYLSFYAGHVASTSAALSAASMTYNYRYGPHVWPWVATGVVSVSEAYMRSAAGKHFYTDDLAGLAIGTAVGVAVPMLHHRKSPNILTLAPENHGAQLVWSRTF